MKRAFLPLAASTALLAGCGSASPGCVGSPFLDVGPSVATADSSARSPGNQQQFTASAGYTLSSASSTCAVPSSMRLVHPVWTNPDPLHISISSADDQTNGLAACTGPTSGPVTLTATTGSGTSVLKAVASLTCN